MSEKPLRLHKHEELLEAMLKGAGLEDSHVNRLMMEPILDALLEAAVKLGVGGPGITVIDNVNCKFVRDPVSYEVPDTLILRLEASDDNA